MSWHNIPEPWDTSGKIHLKNVAGTQFCLVFQNEQWFAFSKKCPHAGAPLVNGWCENGQVICPYHRQCFDLVTGKGDEGQGNFIRIYPTKMEGDKLFVDLPEGFLKRLFGKK